MREIRLYGSEGGGAVCSPYPYPGGAGALRTLVAGKGRSSIFSQLPFNKGEQRFWRNRAGVVVPRVHKSGEPPKACGLGPLKP
jgi:hypothetical protein